MAACSSNESAARNKTKGSARRSARRVEGCFDGDADYGMAMAPASSNMRLGKAAAGNKMSTKSSVSKSIYSSTRLLVKLI